jgi:sugar phosphate isomerase/epimerase
MLYTRRDMGRIALATGFASAFGSELLAAPKPNSKIKGVQIGVITYSFRELPDQSAEATLKYTVDSGISSIELMGGPVNDWARKKGKWDSSPAAAAAAAVAAARGGAGGRGARGGGAPGGGGRGPAPTWAPVAGMKTGYGNDQPAGQWNGQACPVGRGGGPEQLISTVPAAGAPAAPAAARAGAPAPGGGGGGRGRGPQTPEQIAATEAERKWRLGLSMDIFKELRKLYNDAGVSIYAVKDVRDGTDEDLEYTFTVAKALGADHVTLELPAGPNAAASLKKMGDWAAKYKMFSAYHTHQQGSMTCFDEAFAISKGNMANVDLGHFVAATNPSGTPLDFLNKHHGRISSFHIKDRTTVAHCALNLPWGTGETPLKEILQLVSKNKWKMPASVELEYSIPQGSDSVTEVAKCLAYCRQALA